MRALQKGDITANEQRKERAPMKVSFGLAIAAALLSAASVAKADSLYGTQVTLTVDYPTIGDVISNYVTQTVGPDIEFPSGTLIDTLNGTHFLGQNVDVGMSTIDIVNLDSGSTISTTFNGYVFTFTGATILSATLDPTSTLQVPITFGANYVTVNEEGLTLTPSSNILVDLTASTTSTPEPQSYLLISGGLVLLRLIRFRRRSVV